MVYEHDSMVVGMEKAHPQCIPRPVSLDIRYNILDYLLRIIIGTIKMTLIIVVVCFAISNVVGVCSIYYSRHIFIIT